MDRPRLLATSNPNKFREFQQILGPGWSLEQVELDLLEPQGIDVREIIETKAKDAFAKVGEPVLVEDTGLEFDAWNGLPGALVKFFGERIGYPGVLRMLGDTEQRGATARLAVGFASADGCRVYVGELRGQIAREVRGTTRFGWDPIFVPEGSDRSFAEMTAEEKNAISHRRRALELLRADFPDAP